MTDLGADHFERWREDEATAEAMIPLMGRLYRDNDVILYIFGKKLTRTSIEIMKAHRYARNFIDRELSVQETMPVLVALTTMQLDSAKIDIEKLAAGFQDADTDDLEAYLHDELSSVTTWTWSAPRGADRRRAVRLRPDRSAPRPDPDRTGRLRRQASPPRIVLRPQKDNDVEKRASLLRRDSIHGPFSGTVIADEENDQIIVNGNPIKLIYASQPEDIDYTAYGIKDAIIIDNTGAWRDMNGLSRHLQANGASRRAHRPEGRGEEHHLRRQPRHPHRGRHGAVRRELHDQRDRAAAQGDERPLWHRRRARRDGARLHQRPESHRQLPQEGAPRSFCPAQHGDHRDRRSNGRGEGPPRTRRKLTGNAIRVPVPNVSLAILNLTLETEATVADINTVLRDASMSVDLGEQIDYTTSTELVERPRRGRSHEHRR